MDDLQMHSADQPMRPESEFGPADQQANTMESSILGLQDFTLPDANLGFVPLNDPAIFQPQLLAQDASHQNHVDSGACREILAMLRYATPKTQESVLHLLRSIMASRNSGTSSQRQFIDPAVQEYHGPFDFQDILCDENDGGKFSTLGDGNIMFTRSAYTPLGHSDELHETTPDYFSEPMEPSGSQPRPQSLPAQSDETARAFRQMAHQPRHSAPGRSQSTYKPKNPLGSASMSSQTTRFDCDCGSSFSTPADRKRHKDDVCPKTEDKVRYTCLLHVEAPTCHRLCKDISHQNKCPVDCPKRSKHDESGTKLYQKRPDKMRKHLEEMHGLSIAQGQIPKAWVWPMKRILVDDVRPLWACELCGTLLGRWEEDSALINRHVVKCDAGKDARETRFPGKSDALLNEELKKGELGTNMKGKEEKEPGVLLHQQEVVASKAHTMEFGHM